MVFIPKLDEEKEKSAAKEFDFDEEDEFVKMYHMKRLQEMQSQAEKYVSSIRQDLEKDVHIIERCLIRERCLYWKEVSVLERGVCIRERCLYWREVSY